jgi:hypothetical protein
VRARARRSESFLLLFFKKEALAFFVFRNEALSFAYPTALGIKA